jgi:dihydrofolate reductase
MSAAQTREVLFIVARALDGTIALNNDVPWKISADLKRFKRLTMGADNQGWPMIMGRKTGLLPGRRHIVLTRQQGWQAPGAEVAHTVDQALALAGDGDLAIIGGADIFALFLSLATRLEITEIDEHTQGDVFMDPPGSEWVETARDAHPATGDDPAYAFVTYERRR